MDEVEFAERVKLNLPYDPNEQQALLIDALARFCSPQSPANSVFLLNGYAGTGKTSLTGALVKTLYDIGIHTVLLAPTGRAAKVFAQFAKRPAYTIHHKIYIIPSVSEGAYASYRLASNTHCDTIFIVDEASMIGKSQENALLDDLIHYVYSGERCRLILLGDTAQLPPVGCDISPAMDLKTLKSYGLRVTRAVLTATVRQSGNSGILYNATRLRGAMQADPLPKPVLYKSSFDDVEIIAGEELSEEISKSYDNEGISETILITRSNKRAKQFNLAIRANILYKEEVLEKDEQLLIAKNNYFWSAKVSGLDFIANGDVATIVKIYGTEKKYGFHFADVCLQFPDHFIEIDAKILLETLVSDSPNLEIAQSRELYNRCISDPENFSPNASASKREEELKKNPYFNALQVKYAYAITCHKAQGGQWSNVFIDMGSIDPQEQTLEFYRWLYTATSRAAKRLCYVNPSIEVK